ncbi:MAG: membrane protein insertase YidC, partial [Flavobacteriales bacterium]|nr:membrane protein insertase YidC [Flavobacteriales bacterium]
LAMRLEVNSGKYIEYVYTLQGNTFLVDLDVNTHGMQQEIAANVNRFDIHWQHDVPRQEKDLKNERINTTIFYHYMEDGETDHLSMNDEDDKNLEAKTSWIGMKQQFFTSALLCKEGFEKPIGLSVKPYEEGEEKYLKQVTAELSIPYDHQEKESQHLQFYFGPNHYKTLQSMDVGMENIIPLGWAVFKWVNKYCVIPVFHFLDSFNMSYGVIILLLTLLIKLVLFPLTFKTYLSGAKMRILKPELEELNKKFKPEEAMKKQQATMALYRQAGVNPLGGCIPMLLQMPILYALFRFFPASIELRQESFLWATDLSTYDSIMTLPFKIPMYGDHVSLFTLLMTASIFLTMKYNTGQYGGNEQMAKQMKIIMYIMPISFMCFLNNYSSGLTYYYFTANMITFFQQFIIKKFVDEDEIHRKMQENKKKPASQKKSKFQQRLEEMAKQRGIDPSKR